jgi:hypothetical protein
MAGLEALRHTPGGLSSVIAEIDDSTLARSPVRDRSHLLEEVLELIRRRFGDVMTPRTLGRGTYRPCFRLSLGESGSAWLEAHLQSTDDPSLVVPLEEVASQYASAFAFGRRSFSPASAVAKALDKAATIFEPVSRIRPALPWTELTEDELADFVGRAAAALARADFGVALPAELTTTGRARVGLRVHVAVDSQPDGIRSGLTADTLASFRWEASVDGEPITHEEFEAIAHAKRELVRWRGRWILVNERDIATAAPVVGTSGTMPVARAAASALAGTATIGSREASIVPDATLGSLVDRLASAAARADLGEPDGFVGTLRPYQSRGVGWLHHLEASGFGGCLADDMGLGKTIMVIALALHDERPTLVVCPTSVIGNWEREVHRFAPSLDVQRHHGSPRARTHEALAEALTPRTIVLTSYGLLRRDRSILGAIDWGRVVLDEAQNIKNPVAQQTRAARSLRAHSRLALTGTPVENRLTDLWSIMEFCNPGLLGPQEDFVERFAGPVERGNVEATERLRRIVRPFVLRRLKTDP